MKNENNLKMAFVCNQQWDTMNITENGRYCALCKHEVFDFTNKNFHEIKQIQNQRQPLCGIYRTEQVDADLRPVELGSAKRALAFISMLFFLQIKPALSQEIEKPKTEQVEIKKVPASANNVEKASSDITTCRNTDAAKTKNLRKHKGRRIYLSKRFPFIVMRKRHTMGFR